MNGEILRSTPATLELRVYQSGDLTDLDADPTLVVTDGNGTVVSSGAVSKPGATTGIYRSNLPAQADLKVLDAAWTGLLDTEPLVLHQDYEIVGNVLFTEAEARNAPIVGMQNALSDDTKYDDAYIANWRAVITDIMEQRMRRGVIQRYCRLKVGGNGYGLDLSYGNTRLASGAVINRPGRLWDISRVISATANGDVVTVGDLEIVGYKVYGHSWPYATNSNPLNVVIEYEYGPDPVWSEVHQRALDLLLYNAIPKSVPASATSISNEDGTFRITNFPVAVEEFFKQYSRRKGFGVA